MTYKNRKLKKNKSISCRKMKGGNGIGSNCNDPNFSIYNTNLLKLFPYKGGTKEEDAKRERERSKKLQQQIQEEFMQGRTPITDPVQLRRLKQARITEIERDRQNKPIINLLKENETQLISFPTTPMTQKDIQSLQRQQKKDFDYINSEQKKSQKLSIADLGGSIKKMKKYKKTKKYKKGGELTIGDQYKNKEGPHR